MMYSTAFEKCAEPVFKVKVVIPDDTDLDIPSPAFTDESPIAKV